MEDLNKTENQDPEAFPVLFEDKQLTVDASNLTMVNYEN